MDAVRTEFSFGRVFGQINKVIDACKSNHILIRDQNTWGHVPFYNACIKAGKIPLLGVEIGVCEDLFTNKSKTPDLWAIFVPINNEGLKELYSLVHTAYCFKYYQPRISFDDFLGTSRNIRKIVHNAPTLRHIDAAQDVWVGASPSSYRSDVLAAQKYGLPVIALCDNYFPTENDRRA
jgi:DNA polymerase III alpha subunit